MTSQLPLPGRQFQRFLLVFHVVLIVGMGFIVASRWQRPEVSWSWREAALGGLVLAQIGLYLGFFAAPSRWSMRRRWWVMYFCAQFVLWFTTWRLEWSYEWIVLAYLGQMFGVLPPRFSIPGSLAVVLVAFPFHVGWDRLAHPSLGSWLGYLSVLTACGALGLFLHKLTTTSAERALLIQELEAAHREVELARQRDAEVAALKERERLARDLHDSLGHSLVTLSVQLEAAERLCAVDPPRAAAVLEEMKQLTRTSMAELRRSLAGLRAPGLGDRPLRHTLQTLCAETAERSGLEIDCLASEEADHLPPAVAEALWRAAQEGLANVEKHARAQRAQILIGFTDQREAASSTQVKDEGRPTDVEAGSITSSPHVSLRVVDDGVGLPAGGETKAGHYGLRGLRERIEGLGGLFTLSATEAKGTTLEARIPLPGAAFPPPNDASLAGSASAPTSPQEAQLRPTP